MNNLRPTALEQPYLDFVRYVYENGDDKNDRTNTGTRSSFGYMMRFSLANGAIPIPTVKFVPTKTVFDELSWILEGSTNNERLREINQMHSTRQVKETIWEEWADQKGELGPVYGEQWRSWPGRLIGVKEESAILHRDYLGSKIISFERPDDIIFEGIDQIQNAKDALENNPDSRRIIVSAWNPAYVDQMKLPPCHALFQFYTIPMSTGQRITHALNTENGEFISHLMRHDEKTQVEEMNRLNVPHRRLKCMLYQRSADMFLGVPFNIVSYSMLVHMMAHQLNMVADEFIWVGGDCHIYSNHFQQVEEMLSRTPSEKTPRIQFVNKPKSLFEYQWPDIQILDYEHQGTIAAPVAV